MLREKHKGRKPRGESTDALAWGGPACISEEGSVMGSQGAGLGNHRFDTTGNRMTSSDMSNQRLQSGWFDGSRVR